MTREKAIKILEEIIDEGWLISDFEKCTAIDACEMAIKALKQEPCEDCISREKALELAENSHHLAEIMEDLAWLYENNLKALPSVQPKQESVIHSKWERGYSFPDGEYWKCLHCNELIKVKIPMHYCNNCGAKMDKE